MSVRTLPILPGITFNVTLEQDSPVCAAVIPAIPNSVCIEHCDCAQGRGL